MKLSSEITSAAEMLGKCIHQAGFMDAYLKAVEEFQADPEARQLEEQLYASYTDLITSQGAGEQLSREETQQFYELRRQVQSNPVIAKRDSALQIIKPHLAEIADEINTSLGVDFTSLAKPGE
jgi:cell fate (sporulation/competence/biofilm development) regulator YlbF (YheA/YmcA/DUF963 family)